jgi:NAD+ synthase (glutamine-hydrolysing)
MKKQKNSELNIMGAQVNFTVGDVEGNAQKHLNLYKQAVQQKVDVLVLPELSLVGYPLEDVLKREYVVETAMAKAKEIAAQTVDGTAILFGLPRLSEDGKLYNSAYFAFGGRVVQVFDKTDLPNEEVFDEKRYFVSGSGSGVTHFKGFTLGIAICEDVWHARVAQNLKNCGAEAILSMNASPFQLNKHQLRCDVVKLRTRETTLPVFYLNLIGGQDELVFDGGSFTWDPHDQIPTNIQPAFEKSIFKVSLRRDPVGCYFHRGSDALQLNKTASVYEAICMGTTDYLRKNNFGKVVLGLSGGVDSALVLDVACRAVGAENVIAVMMPYDFTTPEEIVDAERIAKKYGVDYRVIPIKPIVDAFISQLKLVGIVPTGVTMENLQSRARGVILMAISNQTGAMVLSTGNKSEVAVGNCTLYGDMCGGFNPLKDIPKTMVWDICRHVNDSKGEEMIPTSIIDRPPMASLAANQKDSDKFPEYDILDPLLECYIEKNYSIDQIVAEGFDFHVVSEVIHHVNKNEFKRRQAPPGVKVTSRSFIKSDWRLPLTNGYKQGYFVAAQQTAA